MLQPWVENHDMAQFIPWPVACPSLCRSESLNMYNFWDNSLPQPSKAQVSCLERGHPGKPPVTRCDTTSKSIKYQWQQPQHGRPCKRTCRHMSSWTCWKTSRLRHKVNSNITIQLWFDFLQLTNKLWQLETSSEKIDIPFKILCPFSTTMLNILYSIPRSSGQNMDRTLNQQQAETLDGEKNPFSSRLKYQTQIYQILLETAIDDPRSVPRHNVDSPPSTPDMVRGKIYMIATFKIHVFCYSISQQDQSIENCFCSWIPWCLMAKSHHCCFNNHNLSWLKPNFHETFHNFSC